VQIALELIEAIRGARGHGLVWKGRPPWMTDALLVALRDESASFRALATAGPGGLHWFTGAGPLARAWAESAMVRDFVEAKLGEELGPACSNFNYYDRAGDAAYPHVDEPEFGLNVLLMLEHVHDGTPSSALWLYPVGQDPIRIDLVPGELVVFHARSTVHERSALGDHERVRIVSAGFSWPQEQEEES
jgi:hypothetical protein